MAYRCLKACDGRSRGLLADWESWMQSADLLYVRFLKRLGESPFFYHEVAAVGFLANAAACAGFLPVNEYDIVKRAKSDKRIKVPGRADLWIDSGPRCYSFEFKRAWVAATPNNLSGSLEAASDDIRCVSNDEYHYAAAGLLAAVRDEHRIQKYEAFAHSDEVDLAYHVGPEGENGAYIFFRLKE
jgi:hypothetical protein